MGDKNELTARENEVLALAWQCFDKEPKVDMEKLAGLTGYTPGSAAFTMGKIKRKLKNKTAGITEDNPAPKKTSGRPRTKSAPNSAKKPGKRTAPFDTEHPVDDSPSKRTKAGGGPNKSNPKGYNHAAHDDDDEEFSFGKIKKEELDDINTSANNLFGQMTHAARYGVDYGDN